MANEKLQACYELHALCNYFADVMQTDFYLAQFEILGMQPQHKAFMDALGRIHDVVQENTTQLTSGVH